MRTVALGTTQAPNVVLGVMRIADLDDEAVRTLVNTARDAGINVIDHAAIYGHDLHGCERRFAEAMQRTSTERAELTLQPRDLEAADQGRNRPRRRALLRLLV